MTAALDSRYRHVQQGGLTADDRQRLNGCVLDILEKQKRGLDAALEETLQGIQREAASPPARQGPGRFG